MAAGKAFNDLATYIHTYIPSGGALVNGRRMRRTYSHPPVRRPTKIGSREKHRKRAVGKPEENKHGRNQKQTPNTKPKTNKNNTQNKHSKHNRHNRQTDGPLNHVDCLIPWPGTP